VKNESPNWVNVAFGFFPIDKGTDVWEYTFCLDSAKGTTTMEIGVCRYSDLEAVTKSNLSGSNAGTIIRNKGWVYSWGGNSANFLFGANGNVYYPFNVNDIIRMRINMPHGHLGFWRENTLLAEFHSLPRNIVPIACLANNSHDVQVTLLDAKRH